MTKTISEQSCRDLHRVYVTCTGLELVFTMPRMYAYERFLVHGFTGDDLRLVVGYLRDRIRQKQRRIESLAFRNLIERVNIFEEDLSMAKAEHRKNCQAGDRNRLSVMAAIGLEPDQRPARSAAQILADAKALEAFREFKNSL